MSEAARAPLLRTIWRGARLKCPQCGAAPLFRAYLKLVLACPRCGADFSRAETADVAPYVTVLLVGLVGMPPIVALSLTVNTGAMLAPVLACAAALTLVLLPRVKGVLAALLWRARREM